MTKAEEILIKHCMEFRDEFLDTPRSKRQKKKILEAFEEYAKNQVNTKL